MASVVCRHDSGDTRHKPGLTEIFDRYLADYLKSHRISHYQERIISTIQACRTSALGGHVYRCKECGYKRHEYDSCRNRHCPQCQVYQKVKWVANRLAELLPIPYYHGIFTLPHSLNDLALYNKELIYDMFFKATSGALNAFSQDPRFLGAKLGFIGILHTWGQKLNQHIHIHYIITGGGLSSDGKRWVNLPYRKKFLFPAKAISRRVRRDFSKLLWQAYRADKLIFPDSLAYLKEPYSFDRFLNKVAWENWNCYMKEPFGTPEIVVKYIGRYTHRIAISNGRLNRIFDGEINFDYKKYQNGKVYRDDLTLDSDEFIRRFLLHIIPSGFKRIRYFGFMASGMRTKALATAQSLLDAAAHILADAQAVFDTWGSGSNNRMQCPECKTGFLQLCEIIAPLRQVQDRLAQYSAARLAPG